MRERIPVPKRLRNAPPAPRRKIPTTFLRRNAFYCFLATILFTSLGNFLPSIFTVSFSTSLGYSTSRGTLVVAMMKWVPDTFHLPRKQVHRLWDLTF